MISPFVNHRQIELFSPTRPSSVRPRAYVHAGGFNRTSPSLLFAIRPGLRIARTVPVRCKTAPSRGPFFFCYKNDSFTTRGRRFAAIEKSCYNNRLSSDERYALKICSKNVRYFIFNVLRIYTYNTVQTEIQSVHVQRYFASRKMSTH